MPEIRYYVVEQTRQVRVTANDTMSAHAIAAAAFEHGQNIDNGVKNGKAPQGVWGNTTSSIKEVQFSVFQDRDKR